jgi:hypothetical protein
VARQEGRASSSVSLKPLMKKIDRWKEGRASLIELSASQLNVDSKGRRGVRHRRLSTLTNYEMNGGKLRQRTAA